MNKYNEIMETIALSPESERRILNNALAGKESAFRRASARRLQRFMRLGGTLAACLALAVAGGVLWGQNASLPNVSDPPVLAVPSMEEYDTIDALQSTLSFPLTLPAALPKGYVFDRAVNQFGMAQIIYANGDATLRYFMAEGSGALNSSIFAKEITLENGATLLGDDGYTCAQWQDETYSYSFVSSDGLTQEQWETLLALAAPEVFG